MKLARLSTFLAIPKPLNSNSFCRPLQIENGPSAAGGRRQICKQPCILVLVVKHGTTNRDETAIFCTAPQPKSQARYQLRGPDRSEKQFEGMVAAGKPSAPKARSGLYLAQYIAQR